MAERSCRREFLRQSLCFGGAALAAGPLGPGAASAADKPGSRMAFGLVTYLWGKDWDLPTLIAHCAATQVLGVELRTTHAHGVEPQLNARQRREVKKRFDDSPVTLVGPGSNECYDNPDPQQLRQAVETTKAFVKLSHDCGGGGVKVKPNSFHKNVPRRKTIEQIGASLNEVGRFAGDYGQQIRLEVHGQCSPLPIIKQIMDVADDPRVHVCWNSNTADLQGQGLVHNFNLVKDRFGATAHVRELNAGDYPYQELMNLFVAMDYAGWILLEARGQPKDRPKALAEQRRIWETMVAKAGSLGRRTPRVT